MSEPLSAWTDANSVENVVIFVSDALRLDYLPREVRELGVTAGAIAPSTFTASALPSLMTGQCPATHKVWMFDDRLAERPPLLTPDGVDVGFDAEGVWTKLESADKPPLQIHHLDAERKLRDADPPFVHVIHDVGPHAPYGFENGVFDSTKAFFRDYENRRPRLVDLYREDCHNSAGRFLDVYDQLRERDLLEDTLVVFTSDHGQCLGERRNGGRFGHGHPMCPETVEIPIVFIGAGLPRGRTYPSVLSGTDVAPTALSAQRGAAPADVDGADVWQGGSPPGRKHRSDVWQHLELSAKGRSAEVTIYGATGVWNDSGGIVFHRRSRLQRLGAVAYDNLFRGYSPAWLHNSSPETAANLVRLSLARKLTFGAPDFTVTEARRLVPDEFREGSHEFTDQTLSEEQESQLRDLGYLK